MSLENKVALVTGGASGIGFECLKEMLKDGLRGATIVDVNEETGKEATAELNKLYGDGKEKVIFVNADVSKLELEDAFRKTVQEFKNIDIVCNNAGIVQEANWRKCYDVNLVGATNCLSMAIEEYLPKYSTGEPTIINTASLAGLEPWYGFPQYTASKFGVIGLTLCYGSEPHYKRKGVKVMAICPGPTATRLLDTMNVIHQKMLEDGMANSVMQGVDSVGRGFMHVLKHGRNGSIWVMEDDKCKEVIYPNIFR